MYTCTVLKSKIKAVPIPKCKECSPSKMDYKLQPMSRLTTNNNNCFSNTWFLLTSSLSSLVHSSIGEISVM